LDELTTRIQHLAELIGPNTYLQAAIIAAVFIVAGKIADWIISGVIGRIANRSSNNFDDQLVGLVHRPVFLSFVLLGLGLASRRIGMPDAPLFITLGILKTIAIFVWYGTLSRLLGLVVRALGQTSQRKGLENGMLTLLHNVMKVVLVALTVYFLFLAWNIDVTAPRTRCPTCLPAFR